MRIPTHRLPPPTPWGGGPAAIVRPTGGRLAHRTEVAAEVRWPAGFGIVGAVARLATEQELLRHLALTVTLDGAEVVLVARIKDPADTAGRDRLATLLAQLQDHPK
ncbi:hypothetical protein Ais01nite_45520 [Asanoa ishikariensis]|uniref:Uncharacterized protein n=1 Tax=Asanoa ishikariensis TaxID=137265 RepID=A0A1H3S436_9ACTN|nr:hypothetical protein Ais01nite_45520 [Asanoa ishikariensis]SDZ32654.1 hypothetical protein SAMN05421684_4529 [Asanoa ishikariensis]